MGVAVGFENLMAKAEEIRRRAIAQTLHELREQNDGESNDPSRDPAVIARVEAAFDDVPGLFAPFTRTPDPAAFDGPIDALKLAMGRLSCGDRSTDPISTNGTVYPANPELAKITSAAADVFGWSGAAAQEFKTGYLDPFPAVVSNQFTLTAAVKAALEAEKAIWLKTREDIWKLADNTCKRIESLNDCTQVEWTMLFTVVAAVCFIVAVPVAAPAVGLAGAATTITAVGAAASAVAVVPVENPPTYDIEGATALQVVNSMREAVNLQIQYTNQTEERIREALNNLTDAVWTAQSSTDPGQHVFCTKRPWLASSNANLIRSDMGYTD
jgi:hypothetical protein